MKRTFALISILLAASGCLAECTSTTATAHPYAGRFTLQVMLDATKVDVGTLISGTAIARNETNKSISWSCPQGSVVVGLVGHGATFNPITAGPSCSSKYVFKRKDP